MFVCLGLWERMSSRGLVEGEVFVGILDRICIELREWCCGEFCWRREACEDAMDRCGIWCLIWRNVYGNMVTVNMVTMETGCKPWCSSRIWLIHYSCNLSGYALASRAWERTSADRARTVSVIIIIAEGFINNQILLVRPSCPLKS